MVFGAGDPDADLMIVGEAPGAEEDLTGRPFVGRSGKLLDRLLAEVVGVERDAVYISNVVKCRPPDNRNPTPAEVATCRPYLEEQLRLVAPRVVVTLGNFSTRLLLDTQEGITRLRGRSYRYGDAALVPTLHPAAVLRGGANAMASITADLDLARREMAGAAT